MTPAQCPNCNNYLGKGRCSLCGYSSIPQWIRLRHADGMAITFRRGSTPGTRSLIHKYFRNVCSVSGHPIAAYFPSDESPLFFVTGSEEGWVIGNDLEYRNKVMIDGKELRLKKQLIKEGSCLQVFSEREKTFAVEFVFEFS